jgi:SNF2 family DNA or RNA helicase
MMTLKLLLRKWRRKGDKVLLFSNLTTMLDLLQCFCVLEGHNYLRLDGGTQASHRQQLVDKVSQRHSTALSAVPCPDCPYDP